MKLKLPRQIGLTGGIGAGKTIVSQIFNSLGVPIFDSDKHGKYLLEYDHQVIEAIINIFGEEILTKNNIDKKKLACIIFANKSKLRALNNIIHPRVIQKFKLWIKQQSTPYIIKESALLFEANTYKMMDKIILIKAPIKLRIQRVKHRDNKKEIEIRRIIRNQFKLHTIKKNVHYIINNNEKTLLTPQIINLHHQLIQLT